MKCIKNYAIIFSIICLIYPSLLLAEEISYAGLIGKWHDEAKSKNGNVTIVEFEILPDHTFKGDGTINGGKKITYSGNVKLEGNELIWEYLLMNNVEYISTDKDFIISVSPNNYTFRSGTSGQTRTAYRVK